MGTSLLGAIFIVFGAIADKNNPVRYNKPTLLDITRAYATITFAYGGHAVFPTLQHDMRRPHEFWKAVLLAYFGLKRAYYSPPNE